MRPKPLTPAARSAMLGRRPLRGFTLIELVMVIVILGVLAAVALPKFIDTSSEARLSALRTTAAAISAGSATNFAALKTGSSNASPLVTSIVCRQPMTIYRFLSTKDIGTTYTLTPDPSSSEDCGPTTGNATVSCILTDKQSQQSTPVVIYCAAPPSL